MKLRCCISISHLILCERLTHLIKGKVQHSSVPPKEENLNAVISQQSGRGLMLPSVVFDRVHEFATWPACILPSRMHLYDKSYRTLSPWCSCKERRTSSFWFRMHERWGAKGKFKGKRLALLPTCIRGQYIYPGLRILHSSRCRCCIFPSILIRYGVWKKEVLVINLMGNESKDHDHSVFWLAWAWVWA